MTNRENYPFQILRWFCVPLLATLFWSPDMIRANEAQTLAIKLAGPAGSTVLVDPVAGTELVDFALSTRSGSARDPRGKDGLSNFAAEVARHGAAGKRRTEIDLALDHLGASLDVITYNDSVALTGRVLADKLDAYLGLVADIVLRPDFEKDEVQRTRREVLAEIDENRNDDRVVGERFFAHRLYGKHGYGRAIDGTEKTLQGLDAEQLRSHYRAQFSGANIIFAGAGAVDATTFPALLTKHFGTLPTGKKQTLAAGTLEKPSGWRIQIVDKPDRKQVQMIWGHHGLQASHPDRPALQIALDAFGGGAMNATLMQEIRVKRGLSYGASMSLSMRVLPGPIRGSLSTSEANAVETLRLVLRLYSDLKKKGLSSERVALFRQHLIGSNASGMDDQGSRIATRILSELAGLPIDHLESFSARIAAQTDADVARAIAAHLDPQNLAITLVGTALTLKPLLLASGIAEGAIDVVAYDSY
jgi:zinc protease